MVNRINHFGLEHLEDRRLMAADGMAFFNGASTTATKTPVAEAVSSASRGSRATEFYDPSLLSDPERDQFMGLPLLDSNPGAPKTLYLDFTGHAQATFSNHRGTFPLPGKPIVTPAYNTTWDPGIFSLQEQTEIKQIWARVAEDFAPFNINVTTHYYGDLTNGQVLKVAIGGHPTDWYINWETSAETPPGTSSDNSFNDPSKPNTVFVFSDDIFNATFTAEKDNDGRSINMVATVSNTASHEAGHAFGLDHLAKYVNGKRVDVYDGGTAEWTPIMGDNLASDRTTWGYGPTAAGPKVFQNDVQILGSTLGLRADDHSNSRFNATPLIGSNLTTATPKTGKGIIEWQADVDLFKFTTTGGPIKVHVKAAEFGPNMWVKAQLWNETGFVAAGVSGLSNFQSIVSASVPAGNYYVVVQGNGGYGHLGQYTVQVTQETPVSKGPIVKGVDVVGPVGPATSTKTKSTAPKSAKMVSAESPSGPSNDGNSNDHYFASMATTRSSPPVGIPKTTKSVPLSRSLSNSLKDAAFDSLFGGLSRV